jgi:hypothetical protein
MKDSKKQIFITGCYKSGTDYTTQLIGNHPKISSIFDINFLRYCYDRFNPIHERYKECIIHMDSIIRKRHNRSLNINSIITRCEQTEYLDYWRLYDYIMSDLCFLDRKKERVWADKSQLSWRLIPHMLEELPNAKAIIVIRNPKAVLASFKTHTYADYPLHLGAIFNCYDAMKHAEIYENLFPHRFTKLKYEDLLHHPESTITSVFEFLGLSAEHDLFDSSNWKDPSGKPWKFNTSYKDEPFDPHKSARKWKTVLEDWEKSMCDKVNLEYYNINGYEPAYLPDNNDIPTDVLEHPTIKRYLSEWLFRSSGIQEFPTDPLKEENWTVNK